MSVKQRKREYERVKALQARGHGTIQMPENLRKEFEKLAPPPKVGEKKAAKPNKKVEKKE